MAPENRTWSQSSKPRALIGTLVAAAVMTIGLGAAHALDLAPVQTGQKSCWDQTGAVVACAGTGQDGDVRAGVAWPDPRFTDNGDGTITDELTGIMWLKDPGCIGTVPWQDGLDAVAAFNTDPAPFACTAYTATHDDWRVSNISELMTLYNHESADGDDWLMSQGFVDVVFNYFERLGRSDPEPVWIGDRCFVTIPGLGGPQRRRRRAEPTVAGQRPEDRPGVVLGCVQSTHELRRYRT